MTVLDSDPRDQGASPPSSRDPIAPAIDLDHGYERAVRPVGRARPRHPRSQTCRDTAFGCRRGRLPLQRGSYDLGAIDRYVGYLCRRLDQPDEAEHHYRNALAIHQGMQAQYWIARTQMDLADLLLHTDHDEAQTLATAAATRALAYGYEALAARASQINWPVRAPIKIATANRSSQPRLTLVLAPVPRIGATPSRLRESRARRVRTGRRGGPLAQRAPARCSPLRRSCRT